MKEEITAASTKQEVEKVVANGKGKYDVAFADSSSRIS